MSFLEYNPVHLPKQLRPDLEHNPCVFNGLTLADRLGEVNSFIYYLHGGNIIDWTCTDHERQAQMSTLPSPPPGQDYVFVHHEVRLVPLKQGTLPRHVRRKITGKSDKGYGFGDSFSAYLAEKAVRDKQEMRDAIAQTRATLRK